MKIKKSIHFLDIDVDFFDENVFPYTYCKKPNGFTMDEFQKITKQLDLESLKIISVSEYIQILDYDKHGVEFILKILANLLTK